MVLTTQLTGRMSFCIMTKRYQTYDTKTQLIIERWWVKTSIVIILLGLIVIFGIAYPPYTDSAYFHYQPNNVTWACPQVMDNGTVLPRILPDNYAANHYQTLIHDRGCVPLEEKNFVLVPTEKKFATHMVEVTAIT